MKVFLTVDVERDCPPYLNTWRGIREGLPLLLDFLDGRGTKGTFFVSGDVAGRHPNLWRASSRPATMVGYPPMTHQPLSTAWTGGWPRAGK